MPTCNHDLDYYRQAADTYRQEHDGQAPYITMSPWCAACQSCRDTLVAEETCLPGSPPQQP